MATSLQLSAVLFIRQYEPKPRLARLEILERLIDILKRILLVPRVDPLLHGELEHPFDLGWAADEGAGDGGLFVKEGGGGDGHWVGERSDQGKVAVRSEEVEIGYWVEVGGC